MGLAPDMVVQNFDGTYHILMADHSAADRDIFRRAFEDCKITCHFAELDSGEALLRYLSEAFPCHHPRHHHPVPDLLLLDTNMPRMAGLELLGAIRLLPQVSRLPVVILTTTGGGQHVPDYLEAGANAHLRKPTNRAEYREMVAALEAIWFNWVRLPGVMAPPVSKTC